MNDDVFYKLVSMFSHEELAGMYAICNKRERELEKEIAQKDKIIELLKKSNEFYSNRETWLAGCNIGFDCVSKDEMEYLDCGNLGAFKYGGKLAREIKKQVKELEK